MRIITKDLRKGIIKVKVDDLDDLWHLSEIAEQGDLISGKTERKVKIGSEEEKRSVSRKVVFLEVKIEKTELSEESLRALGTITQGPDDIPIGSHHSFNISTGDVITIKKESWPKFMLSRLEEACKAKKKLLILVFDRENALFALTKKAGVKVIAELEGQVEKKRIKQKSENFFKKLVKVLEEYKKRYNPNKIIVTSPAFWNEELMKEADEELKNSIITASCSSATKNAVTEVLKRPELSQTLKDERAAQELNYIQDLMLAISKDTAAYGIKDVKQAVDVGAIKTVLVSTGLLKKYREKGKFKELEQTLRQAEAMKAEVHLINSPDACRQLDGLGGIGAVLRFRIQ